MITLVGVGHVMDISNQIHDVIIERMPDAVCLELDRARYIALQSDQSGGDAPMAYRLLANFQKNLAQRYGTQVGGEMLAAIKSAKQINAKVFGIDMDARRTWNSMWSGLTLWHRLKMLFGVIVGSFTSTETIEGEIEAFQDDSEAYLDVLEKQFPPIKKVLIDDRNKYMVSNIKRINERYPELVAFVGDAHIPGMSKAFDPENLEVIRLRELRNREKDSNAYVELSFGGKDDQG